MKAIEVSRRVREVLQVEGFSYNQSKRTFLRKSKLSEETIDWISTQYIDLYSDWYCHKDIYHLTALSNAFWEVHQDKGIGYNPTQLPGLRDVKTKTKNHGNAGFPFKSEISDASDIDLMISEVKPFIFEKAIPFLNNMNTVEDLDRFYNGDIHFTSQFEYRGLHRHRYDTRSKFGILWAHLSMNKNYEQLRNGYIKILEEIEDSPGFEKEVMSINGLVKVEIRAEFERYAEILESYTVGELYDKFGR